MIYRSSDFRIAGDFARVEDGNNIVAFRLSEVESVKTAWISSESVWDLTVRMRSGYKLRLSFQELGRIVEQLIDSPAPSAPTR